jgi:hypothetical protein
VLTKANEDEQGNSSLFAFTNQPLKRTNAKPASRKKPADAYTSTGLMRFNPSPTPASVEAELVDTDDLPAFARLVPIQLFIIYTDRSVVQQKHRVVPWHDLHTQNAELQAAIASIRQDGGTPTILEVIDVRIAVCVSRWEIG